jgi:uncharacterized protein
VENVLSAAEASALERFDREPQLRSAGFETTDIADDGSWFEGYAAVFDEVANYEVPGIGLVGEEVRRGSFRKVLHDQREPIPMLYHHLQEHPPLATTSGGTLILEERAKGLWTRANVARTYIGDAVRELVKRGDIPGMSWGFIATGREFNKIERRAGGLHRTILGFKKILDVSPTWDVTYRGTTAEFRSLALGIAVPVWEEEKQNAAGAQEQSGEEVSSPEPEHEETVEQRAGVDPQEWAAAMQRRLSFLELEGGHDAS